MTPFLLPVFSLPQKRILKVCVAENVDPSAPAQQEDGSFKYPESLVPRVHDEDVRVLVDPNLDWGYTCMSLTVKGTGQHEVMKELSKNLRFKLGDPDL